MGTKTADEAGAETGTEAKSDDVKSGGQTVDITKDERPTEAAADTEVEVLGDADAYDGEDLQDLDGAEFAAEEEGPSGVGQGAAAVVSAVLGFVSLTGSWLGTVAGAREGINGQLEMLPRRPRASPPRSRRSTATPGRPPRCGAASSRWPRCSSVSRPSPGPRRRSGKPQAGWIKSVSWAGVALGVLGLLLAVLKYTDVILGVPSTS